MILFNSSAGESPEISILIPTYNRVHMLEEALTSVFAQDFEGPAEILVVDDHSQDGTPEMVQSKYPAVQLISLQSNIGNYAARNVGLEHAKGKYVAFLDDDDLWKPAYLRTQMEAIRGNDRTFCVSGLVVLDANSGKRFVTQEPDLNTYTSEVHQLMIQNFIYTPSSVLFPRALLMEIGNFDSSVRMGGDADLYIRCLLAGIKPVYTKLPLAIWRIHSGGKLTDVNNFSRANQVRRIEIYYDRVKSTNIGPIRKLYAELDSHIARRYLFRRRFLPWVAFSLRCAARGYPGLMFRNVLRDLKTGVKALVNRKETS